MCQMSRLTLLLCVTRIVAQSDPTPQPTCGIATLMHEALARGDGCICCCEVAAADSSYNCSETGDCASAYAYDNFGTQCPNSPLANATASYNISNTVVCTPCVNYGCPQCASWKAPCFGRDTYATLATGERVPMTALSAGEYVKDGPDSTTRVVVNQHRLARVASNLLRLETSEGPLSLTPDHVLELDGTMAAAREAAVGCKIGSAEVLRISASVGGALLPHGSL